MSQQFDDALHVMEVQGGSFVKSLAACYYAADSTNRPILRQAFTKYFDEYERRFQNSRTTQSGSAAMKGDQP